jgi:protein SCO1
MLELPKSEEEFKAFVDQSASDSRTDQQLIDLLREDHAVYNQRGAATVNRMRGWLILALARNGLPEAALPFVLEELDTTIDPYLVAAAAFALRSYPNRNQAFAPFVVRAITNVRYRDEPASLQTYGGYAVGSAGTSPIRELLTTLVWLGPYARFVMPELELLRKGPTALGMKFQPAVDLALTTIRAKSELEVDCCQLPESVRNLFSSMRTIRTNTGPIEATIFEDQDGASITFGEFFQGRPSIVVFFYTRCDNPLKCSLTITKLARIQQLLKAEGAIDQINTAGITYDPGFDLPLRIRNYGQYRGLAFSARHRLLRATDGFDPLRKHFKLGVNFIESLVNRHRIEVYVLDDQGRIAASFERIQWSENDVVTRALELLREVQNTNAPTVPTAPPRHQLASPLLGTAVALGLALFPKCPLCWAAYLSLFGIASVETIPYSPWLQPVLGIFLLFNLTSVWFRSRATRRMVPFCLVSLGAIALMTSKAFAGLDALGITGVILTLVGSVWSTLAATNRRQLARQ